MSATESLRSSRVDSIPGTPSNNLHNAQEKASAIYMIGTNPNKSLAQFAEEPTTGCHLCEWKGYLTYPNRANADVKRCRCGDGVCKNCEGTGGFEIILPSGNRAWKKCYCQTLERRMELYRNAQIPARFATKTVDAFAPNDKTQMTVRTHIYNMLQNMGANSRLPASQRGLVLMGSPGTGKTHLMVGLLRNLSLDYGIACRFQDFGLLLSELRQSYSSESSEMTILQPLIDVDILMIDDLGKGRNSKWELGVIDILISCRYNTERTTLITTNYTDLPETTLRERFRGRGSTEGEEMMVRDTLRDRVGDRIYSRLQEMCYFFQIKGIDYRQKNAPKMY
jgi:DNA replication protein DnaC